MTSRLVRLREVFTTLSLLLLLVPMSLPTWAVQTGATRPRLPAQFQGRAAMPWPGTHVMFIENIGQLADGARFQLRGAAGTVWLAEGAVWITFLEAQADSDHPGTWAAEQSMDSPQLRDAPATVARRGVNLRLSFVNAKPGSRLEPFDRLPVSVAYLSGNDLSRWRRQVPAWGGVRYSELYDAIDLELSVENGRLALVFVCRTQCASNLAALRLRVSGAEALSSLASATADQGARLKVATESGEFSLPPISARDADGTPLALTVSTFQSGSDIVATFAQAASSTTGGSIGRRPSLLDSSDMLYSTFVGGTGYDTGRFLALDGDGNAYLSGDTDSPDFPTTPGAFDVTLEDSDAYVVKVSADGSQLIYATFLGGSQAELGRGLAINGSGEVYVTGRTESADFPTTAGAYDTSYGGGADVYVTKLSADGSSLIYSTFLGGAMLDWGSGLAVDPSGAAYVTGRTESPDYPTTPGAFDTTHNGSKDAFVTKVNPNGSDLVYSTFLGGSGPEEGDLDRGRGIVVDDAGNAYIGGQTQSADFPTTPDAFDSSYNGSWDGFVVKLNADGSNLIYGTFIGAGLDDRGRGIAVDEAGSAYLAGSARSPDFPTTPGAFDTTHNGGDDAFVIKLSADGSDLVYSTLLGGNNLDWAVGISVDRAGNVYLTGRTESADFPVTPDAFDTTYNGVQDAIVARFDATGSDLVYATFLGGSANDRARDADANDAGDVYLSGFTDSADFPTTARAFDPSYNGNTDAFLVRLQTTPVLISQKIEMMYELFQPGQLVARVRILNPAGPLVVPGATVEVAFDLPDRQMLTSSVTDGRGWAKFTVDTPGGGTCSLTVADVQLEGYRFDADQSVLTKTVSCP